MTLLAIRQRGSAHHCRAPTCGVSWFPLSRPAFKAVTARCARFFTNRQLVRKTLEPQVVQKLQIGRHFKWFMHLSAIRYQAADPAPVSAVIQPNLSHLLGPPMTPSPPTAAALAGTSPALGRGELRTYFV